MKEYKVIHIAGDSEGPFYDQIDVVLITDDYDLAVESWFKEVREYRSTMYDIDDEYHGTGHEIVCDDGWRVVCYQEGYFWIENEYSSEYHIIEIEIL